MSKLELPALDPATVPERGGTTYPEAFRERVAGRLRRRLGDACGLTAFGVNVVTLAPGAHSSLRHWHTLEDEFVYVLGGELTLVTDAGTQVLTAGMCAGYPAGKRDGHHFVNRGTAVATYLEVGNRVAGDNAFYPDDDLMWVEAETGFYAARKDGQRY